MLTLSTTAKDQHEIATKFNEYFGNIGPNLAKKIQGTHQTFKLYMDHRCPNSVFLDAILESEVLRAPFFRDRVSGGTWSKK